MTISNDISVSSVLCVTEVNDVKIAESPSKSFVLFLWQLAAGDRGSEGASEDSHF